jgi:hypothetical protein
LVVGICVGVRRGGGGGGERWVEATSYEEAFSVAFQFCLFVLWKETNCSAGIVFVE